MKISIAERLRPFSHQLRTVCLIPTTSFIVEAFGTLIRIKDFEANLIKEVALEIQGPLNQFTLMQDLERGCVTVFSEQYRIHILPNLEISYQKNPPLSPLAIQERLSLGCHKQQEWESIRRRLDFREIFPLWFRLGSLLELPSIRQEDNKGMFSLLALCKECVQTRRPETIVPAFKKLFLAAFGHLFVPRALDEEYQGILPRFEAASADSPLYLLTEGAKLIRLLFLESSENEIKILPNLPPEFFAGRMLSLACLPFGTLDLEWSKKNIRRMIFHALSDGEILFRFPSSLSHFRLRHSVNDHGRIVSCGDSMEIKSGSYYLLDRFQK